MKLYRILELDMKPLLALPESGLGYQVVRTELGLTIILNAMIAYPYIERQYDKLPEDIYGYLDGSLKDDDFNKLPTRSLSIGTKLAFTNFPLGPALTNTPLNIAMNVISPPAALIATGYPIPYYRFSAFATDRRILPNGDFLPGSYATTHADMPHVPSGFAAVGRYALPNPASARFVYSIHTYTRPSLMGTAAPNFGQAGGGVEVFFATGATHVSGKPYRITAG